MKDYPLCLALYKDGPAFYHASYSVVIRAVREKSPGHYIADTRFHEHDMKWPMMLGCERVIKSTRKVKLKKYSENVAEKSSLNSCKLHLFYNYFSKIVFSLPKIYTLCYHCI